jgi:hypothetical protein
MTELTGEISWTDQLESYFVQTGEQALCLAWLHQHAETLYSRRRIWIDLPSIIGSGVIAFLNAGSSTMFPDPQLSSVALGVGSLIVGLMNTIGTYFSWAKRAEGHRIAALHYAKFHRLLEVQMGLPREERMRTNDFLKYTKDTHDHLMETSPAIPNESKLAFKAKFATTYTDVSRPFEVNGLHKIQIHTDRMPRQSSFSSPRPQMGPISLPPVDVSDASGLPA